MTSSSSSIDPSISLLQPVFTSDGSYPVSAECEAVIKSLNLEPHPEGGYFVQTDRDNSRVPNPYLIQPNGYHKPSADSLVESRSESLKWTGKARVETFVVGPNVAKGERLQWIVEGGTYKGSFLLPDEEGGETSDGLLISETVVPGFEWDDHDYMKPERLDALVTEEQRRELEWILRKDEA
jgi:hypothetical protein